MISRIALLLNFVSDLQKCDVCAESLSPSGVCSICNQPAVCNQNMTIESLVPAQETKIW